MASNKPLEPSINVTPLVDVVLVLLIIFMVIAPKLAETSVDLPKSSTRDPSEDEVVHVAIEKTGAVTIDGVTAPAADVAARLDEITKPSDASAERRGVIIEADQSLAYGEVQPIMDAARRCHASSVALQVIREEP